MYSQWLARSREVIKQVLAGEDYRKLPRYGEVYADDPSDAAATSVNQKLETQHENWLKKVESKTVPSELASAAQLLLFAALYGVAIASIRRRDVATHMRYMICIALVLLPGGSGKDDGILISLRQSSSQTACLLLIDVLLLALIAFDRRCRLAARPLTTNTRTDHSLRYAYYAFAY